MVLLYIVFSWQVFLFVPATTIIIYIICCTCNSSACFCLVFSNKLILSYLILKRTGSTQSQSGIPVLIEITVTVQSNDSHTFIIHWHQPVKECSTRATAQTSLLTLVMPQTPTRGQMPQHPAFYAPASANSWPCHWLEPYTQRLKVSSLTKKKKNLCNSLKLGRHFWKNVDRTFKSLCTPKLRNVRNDVVLSCDVNIPAALWLLTMTSDTACVKSMQQVHEIV